MGNGGTTYQNGGSRILTPDFGPQNYNNQRTLLIQEEPRGPSMLLEIPKVAGITSRFNLPVFQNLQNDPTQIVIIKALRLIPDTVLATAPTLGGANAPLTELAKMCLTIYCEQWEKGQLIPLLTLVDTFTEGSGIPWRNRTAQFANWTNVDWNKSYFTYANGTPSIVGAYNILFEVEYVKLNQEGIEIVGPS